MTGQTRFRVLDHTRMISGRLHRMVERFDGVRFYLDDAFLFALEHVDSMDLSRELAVRGAAPEEIDTVIRILRMAGLCAGDSDA